MQSSTLSFALVLAATAVLSSACRSVSTEVEARTPSPGEAARSSSVQTSGSGGVRATLAEELEEGDVRLLLFDSADTFGDLRDAAFVQVAPAAGTRELALAGIPPGIYALVVHHDVDADGEIDRNFLGIPVEPIAFSRGYRPKGPPVFERARFEVVAGEEALFDVALERTLGERGRLGVGVGVLARGSPYRGSDSNAFRVIPAITYIGNRVQVLGPFARVGILGRGSRRLALTTRYRLGPYEEEDAEVLEGLGDARDTLMLGLALVQELPAGFDAELSYEHDVLDRVGGGEARLELGRSFQLGVARVTPKVGAAWLDSDVVAHDYGVPADRATPSRAAYDPSGALNLEAGVGLFLELGRSWTLVLDFGAGFLAAEIRESPLVDDEVVLRGFFTLGYTF